MPKCTVCHHPQRQDLDLALLAGDATYETLSKIYGPSISSLFRHKKHLEEKMRRTRRRLKDSQQQGCLFKLNAFLDHVQRAVRTAEVDGHVDRIIKGSHVGSRIIHQINQMEMPLELDTVYRLISSPQWVSQDSLLPTDPQIITGIHQALADKAFFPCPDPEPEIIPASTHSSRRGTQNFELETPKPGPEPDPDLDDADDDNDDADDWDEADAAAPDLAPTALLKTRNSEIETCCFPLEIKAKNQREISAKLPKNQPHSELFTKQNQLNIQCEKNAAKNSYVGRESTRRAAYAQAPPANQMATASPQEYQSALQREKIARGTGTSNPDISSLFPDVSPENWKPETVNREPFFYGFPFRGLHGDSP